MGLPKYKEDPAEYMREWKKREDHDFSPRTKMALRLYHTGAARTQKEAAAIAGVAHGTVAIANSTATGRRIMQGMDAAITEKAVDLSALIRKLSEKALGTIGDLIESGSTEEIRLAASKDVLDRNPETSKKSQVQVESFTLGARDAKAIAAALVESKIVEGKFPETVQGDFVKLESPAE